MKASRQIRAASIMTAIVALLILLPVSPSQAQPTQIASTPSVVSAASTVQLPSAVVYVTVVRGNTLSTIARARCNNAAAWRSILRGNPQIKNPNLIYPGMRLRIVCTGSVVVAPARATSGIQKVIAFAMAQRGKPYRWAAAGPNAYDCSGLVMAAFARVGIRLPHQSSAMLSHGVRVSRANLRVGDIVWPQLGHVGLYIGGNKMVNAPHAGARVRVDTLYGFYTARRMM